MVVGQGKGCSSWVLFQEGGRHKNRVRGRVTDRVSPPFTWFGGWVYGNLEVELFAGDFAFELGMVHGHYLVRWEGR